MLAMVDTGADTTTLPFGIASTLGLSTADLEGMTTSGVGGPTRTWRPRVGLAVEVEIGGRWYELPAVVFAENTPPLLGRDILFREFTLRMAEGETELLPRA